MKKNTGCGWNFGKEIPKCVSLNSHGSNPENRGVLSVGEEGIPSCCTFHSAVGNKIKWIYNTGKVVEFTHGSSIFSVAVHKKLQFSLLSVVLSIWDKLKSYMPTYMNEDRDFKGAVM
jgi:hypothetical protein